MTLSLYNTLTRKTDVFKPINNKFVRMYVCGPTVYDHPHIGNARSTVTYDILFRILKLLYGNDCVTYIRNITDVDDKIINKAKENNISISDLTKLTTEYFHGDMAYLSCLTPTIEPKATEHIEEMINMINILINNGCAYLSEGHVYFDVAKAEDYGRLSGRSIEQMLEEVRIENSPGKRESADFVLWKPAKLDDPLTANFESPFGYGRPGWHIECSAMNFKYFGANFDIHGGGADLIFPHHTNEIAQTCAAYPNSTFANYWVHNGFLTVNRQKMSKSLGNFITVNDLRSEEISGDIVRLFLLSNHYRKPLDYNRKAIQDSQKMLTYWLKTIEESSKEEINSSSELPENFMEALFDDLNTSVAIRIINEFAKEANSTSSLVKKAEVKEKLLKCARFIGLMNNPMKAKKSSIDDGFINALIEERRLAKDLKNWKQADEIRDKLLKKGITLEDKSDGTTSWRESNFN